MKDLISFNFRSQIVRAQLDDNGEPLFCLADVCKVLELANPTHAANAIKEEFETPTLNVGVIQRETGPVQATFITEPQLYFVMMRSRSEQARPFRQWVVNEVLPSIRKTGSYSTARQLPELLSGAEIVLAAAGLTGNQLALALDKAYKAHTGASALATSGVQLVTPKQETCLTPTQIAEELNNSGDVGRWSARLVNLYLLKFGYQCKKGKSWEPTEKGLEAGAVLLDTGKAHNNGTPVTQLKWRSSIVAAISKEYRSVLKTYLD